MECLTFWEREFKEKARKWQEESRSQPPADSQSTQTLRADMEIPGTPAPPGMGRRGMKRKMVALRAAAATTPGKFFGLLRTTGPSC